MAFFNPLIHTVSCKPGYLNPPDASPAYDRLMKSRSLSRLVFSVHVTERDDVGNIRKADFWHLHGNHHGAFWVRWPVERRLCIGGMRIVLEDTKRAGLHIRIGVPVTDSALDEYGFRIEKPRFVSSYRPAGNGVHVIVPCDPVEPGYALASDCGNIDSEERNLLISTLQCYFWATAQQAGEILRGSGTFDYSCLPAGYAGA